jgi:L-2-hydroxyglutarate oxidase LhgO
MYDVAIIGGGIVGLATAYRLRERRPDASVVVLEKEEEVALHQSGRNSGVIHSGIYYTPGSLKARTCVAGKDRLYAYCAERGVPHARCGKLILATSEAQKVTLEGIRAKAAANGPQGGDGDAAEDAEAAEEAAPEVGTGPDKRVDTGP